MQPILRSITNKSLQTLAEDIGLEVVRQPIEYTAVKDFKEVGACGTAAVITPVYSLTESDGSTVTFGEEKKAGEKLTELYERLQGTQYGEVEDIHGWMVPLS